MKNTPMMVVPLEEIAAEKPSEQVTEVFSAESETVSRNRFQPSVPTLSIRKPQNKIFILAVFGGLFLILVMIAGAVGGLIYFSVQQENQAVKSKPPPERKVEKPSPSLPPSATPLKSPKETPVESEELIFPPPTKPTRRGSFRIQADKDGWQLSEIETVSSETFRTNVRGTIVLDDIGSNITADGVDKNKKRRVYKEYPTGALLMRTRFANGKTSNIQPVTASDVWENDPEETGRIEFLINDNSPRSNAGQFVVEVSLVKAP